MISLDVALTYVWDFIKRGHFWVITWNINPFLTQKSEDIEGEKIKYVQKVFFILFTRQSTATLLKRVHKQPRENYSGIEANAKEGNIYSNTNTCTRELHAMMLVMLTLTAHFALIVSYVLILNE